MRYDFLVETYETERIKVVSVWSEFADGDLPLRPREGDFRGRSVHEQMVHQCVSEDVWFRNMLGIDVGAAPLPAQEIRLAFMNCYVKDSGARLSALHEKPEQWWEEEVQFFDVRRSRAWVMTRRLLHTSHHRGQLMAMLRMLGRDLHSNYGPTADTGGLMENNAATIYAYSGLDELLKGESAGGNKAKLPGASGKRVTERPALANRTARVDLGKYGYSESDFEWVQTQDSTSASEAHELEPHAVYVIYRPNGFRRMYNRSNWETEFEEDLKNQIFKTSS